MQFQCLYSARLFHPHSGITVSVPIKPRGFQQSFHIMHSCTQQPGSSSFNVTFARGLLCSKIFDVLYPTTTFRANTLCVTFKTILQATPPGLSHHILDIPQPVLTIPAKPMPFGPTNNLIYSLGLHSFAHPVCWNSLSFSHGVTQF